MRALLPNDRGMLKPGMFLTVRLTRGASNALLVPEESLVPEQGNVFVYVVRDDRVEKREVHIGQRRVGKGSDCDAAAQTAIKEAGDQLCGDYMVAVQYPATRVQELYDEITDHGRNRIREACTAASDRLRPESSRSLANSTIRIAFFAARPISTTSPI